jgi:transposase
MAKSKQSPQSKRQALQQSGTFNRRAAKVRDELFLAEEFFDSQDLAQVKYEMLRRVQKDGAQVSQAASSFGFSRPSFYKAQEDFAREGIAGLVPKKRGPKRRHKLTDEIMEFVLETRDWEPPPTSVEIVQLIADRFETKVHRRSVERALIALKKKPQ